MAAVKVPPPYRLCQNQSCLRNSCSGSAVSKSPTSIHEDQGLTPGIAQWVKTQHCHELWFRSQMWLGSGVAVAMAWAGSCSSDLTPGLGTSICCRYSNPPIPPRKKAKKIFFEKKHKLSSPTGQGAAPPPPPPPPPPGRGGLQEGRSLCPQLPFPAPSPAGRPQKGPRVSPPTAASPPTHGGPEAVGWRRIGFVR